MPYDYTDAPPPRDFEIIPAGEIVTVSLHIRPGGAGEGGLLKRGKEGTCEMLDTANTGQSLLFAIAMLMLGRMSASSSVPCSKYFSIN